jgi:hypothetical protein
VVGSRLIGGVHDAGGILHPHHDGGYVLASNARVDAQGIGDQRLRPAHEAHGKVEQVDGDVDDDHPLAVHQPRLRRVDVVCGPEADLSEEAPADRALVEQ